MPYNGLNGSSLCYGSGQMKVEHSYKKKHSKTQATRDVQTFEATISFADYLEGDKS